MRNFTFTYRVRTIRRKKETGQVKAAADTWQEASKIAEKKVKELYAEKGIKLTSIQFDETAKLLADDVKKAKQQAVNEAAKEFALLKLEREESAGKASQTTIRTGE